MGVVQGLTEFLPVSSSGHLALSRHLLGVGLAEDVGFEVSVHAGTLVAVVLFFWKRLLDIVRGAVKGERAALFWILYLAIGTLPAGAIGLYFKDTVARLFNDLSMVAAAWMFTAGLLYISERLAGSRIIPERMGAWRALAIGIGQAVAILPGVSRSGATIATGLICGVDRKGAVDFSFLLSLPVILGAILLTVGDWMEGSVVLAGPHIAGAITAAMSGYLAIAVMLKVVVGRGLKWFAFYCLALGIGTFMFL